MGELWRDLTELLKKRPILWCPVLLADLLGFLVNLGRTAWVHAIVLSHTQYHSVLGGPPVRTPVTPAGMEGASIAALLLTWGSYFGRILLYTSALVVTWALARGFLSRMDSPWREVGPAMRKAGGGILEIALRVLAVYAIAALLLGYINKAILQHGKPIHPLHLFWADQGVALLVITILAFAVSPVAVRLLAQQQASAAVVRQAQWLALTMGLVSLLLGTFVGLNSQTLQHVSAGAAVPLELVGSLMVALPFAPMYAGLSLLARKAVREAAIVPDPDPA